MSLGWDDFFSSATPGLEPARVTRVDRTACDVLGAAGSERAHLAPSVLAGNPSTAVCVGDWVLVDRVDGRTTAQQLLPRRSAIVRAGVAPGASTAQVLAANVDVALILEGHLPEPDLGRVERFLALAWGAGVQPVVVLTKADLVLDPAAVAEEVARASPGAEVLSVSSVTGAGVPALEAVLGAGRTGVLLGPSGAGKSSLVNRLAGGTVMATNALRADGKGRHTTAHRELVVLPGGGILIDTPGLRSVGLTGADDGLTQAFADVDALAETCRFRDCGHSSEPGCAVLAAVEDGELPERRLASWRKLQREAGWMQARTDARLRAEQRSRWRQVTLEMRRSGRSRP
jgi:ribosome biogenesis GTPase